MLVSVYVPTRNRADQLLRAVDSVLSQSYENIELIVVDDSSTDGTADFLRQRSTIDKRLRVLQTPEPGGAPVARNLAIRAANGAFLTGLDDDDRFHEHRIATFIEYWELLSRVENVGFLY